jgi:hypothetical protein
MLDSVLNVLPFGGTISNALSFGREQRDKNAQFQMIQGGSNASMMAERAHMKAYQMSTAGMFSGEEADKAFMGVTALGYNQDYGEGAGEGASRQDMLNFAYKQKSATGATVDESLQHMDTFSKSASAGLTQFSDALIQVGEAAGQAGVNAMEARAMFSQMFGQANAAGMGQASTSFAQTMTNTSTSYGRAYASGVDMSGTTGEGTLRLQAAMMGSSYASTITGSQSGTNVAAMGAQAGIKRVVGMINPGAIKWAKDQIAANPDMGEEEVRELANGLLKKSGMDPMAMVSIAESFTGKQYNGNSELVMIEIVRFLMGEGPMSQAKKVGLVGNDSDGNPTDAYKDLGTTKTLSGAIGSGRGGAAPVYEETTNETGTAYNAMIEAGGERVGALEQVMNKLGAENQDEQMVKIGGKEMSLKEIIESKNPKLMRKVALGKGTLVGGEFEGQKIGEVAAQDNTEDEEEDQDTTATDVKVSIVLSQEAKEWFTANSDAEGNPRTES